MCILEPPHPLHNLWTSYNGGSICGEWRHKRHLLAAGRGPVGSLPRHSVACALLQWATGWGYRRNPSIWLGMSA